MPLLRELEPELWSELEFGACELGDKRRTRRLVRYARQMAEKPDASTPRQTENWADCKAAYRMFEQTEVTFKAVTAAHYKRTLNMAPGTYLVISDTTELDYGYNSQRQGLGRLASDKHRGFFLHSALVVCADNGQVLGLGAQELFTRSSKKKKRVHRVAGCKRPSEADVWGRVHDGVQPVNAGVRLIHVCDRGADNFDVFAHLQEKGDSWVIRALAIDSQSPARRQSGQALRSAGLRPRVGSISSLCGGQRQAEGPLGQVEVHAAEVTLLRPREGSTKFVMDRQLKEIGTNVVEVREVHPPKNCVPVRWVLYTREAASSFAQAVRVIEFYERRPIVEEYHKCLKTGLQVEQRQYQSRDRLEPVIGVICVQAVRLLQLRDVSRKSPTTPAKGLVPSEWLEVIGKVLKRPRPIDTVRDFLRAVASLGGFLGRKSDGEPGWITIWRGLETLLVALRGYRAGLRQCG